MQNFGSENLKIAEVSDTSSQHSIAEAANSNLVTEEVSVISTQIVDEFNSIADQVSATGLVPYEDKILDNVDGEIVFHIPNKSPLVIRDRIWKLKDYLESLPDELVRKDFAEDTTHYFMNGVYTRVLFMRKGEIVIGKVHLQECTNIVAKGDCTILTETGCERVKEGFIGISPKGSQKVVYMHEDTIFINVFLTDKNTIEEAEKALLSENRSDLRDIG